MHWNLPSRRVSLHATRIGSGPELAILPLHGSDSTERPVRPDGDVVATTSQAVDHTVGEPAFELDRAAGKTARIEGRDQVIGVELRRVDCLLQVAGAVEVAEKDMDGPLLLLISAGGSPGEPRLAVA